MQDKLPSPKGDISITLLVPTNGAWLRLLWDSGFFIPSIDKLGDVLPATVLFNTMFGAISSEQVASFSEGSPGSSSSIYGLLSGKNGYGIEYWASAKDDTTAYYFSPEDSLNDQVAETLRPVQVCNSWIYFTNKVLIPSATGKIKDVEKITIPENLPWESSPTEVDLPVPAVAMPPSPAESPVEVPVPILEAEVECKIPDPSLLDGNTTIVNPIVPVVEEEKVPDTCNTTFADAARKAGLGLLATALSQESIKTSLPDPSEPNTLFAPIDSAFLSMLSDLGISITDALGLGNKLTGVILYHVHPEEALDEEQLKQRTSLPTALGARVNDETYSITVMSDGSSNISLGSLKPGDAANIVDRIQVCGTTVYVIDKVLLPAAGVEDLPDPGAPVARRFIKTSSDGILDAGVARAIGPLQFCTVILDVAGQTLSAETNAAGEFYFEGIPECAIDGGFVKISKQDNNDSACVDTLTNLPLPYDFYVDLKGLGNDNISFPTMEAPLLLNPLSTILASPYLTSSASNGENRVNEQIASFLGFASAREMLFGGMTSGSIESAINDNMMAINSQSLVTTLLGGYFMQSFSNISFEEGTYAIDNVIASQLDDMVNLGDPAEIQRIIEEATTVVTDKSIDAGVLDTLQRISGTIAEVNQALKQSAYSTSLDPSTKQENIKATVIMAQSDMASAIQNVAAGQMTLEDFEAMFSPEVIQQNITGQNVPAQPVQEIVEQLASLADMPLLSLLSAIPLSLIICLL